MRIPTEGGDQESVVVVVGVDEGREERGGGEEREVDDVQGSNGILGFE